MKRDKKQKRMRSNANIFSPFLVLVCWPTVQTQWLKWMLYH